MTQKFMKVYPTTDDIGKTPIVIEDVEGLNGVNIEFSRTSDEATINGLLTKTAQIAADGQSLEMTGDVIGINVKNDNETRLAAVESKAIFNQVNVKDYGAVGDGVTDDTEKIQAVIDLFADGVLKGSLVFNGSFKITSTIIIADASSDTSFNLTIRSDWRSTNGTTFISSDNTLTFFRIKTSSGNVRGVSFEGCSFSGGKYAIDANNWAYSRFSNCMLSQSALKITAPLLLKITNNTFYNQKSLDVPCIEMLQSHGGQYGNTLISGNSFGEYINQGIKLAVVSGINITDNEFFWCDYRCINATGGSCTDIKITNNTFTGFSGGNLGTGAAIISTNSADKRWIISGNTFDNSVNATNDGAFLAPATSAIQLSGAQDYKIKDNIIIGLPTTLIYGIVNGASSDNYIIKDNSISGMSSWAVLHQNASASYLMSSFTNSTETLLHTLKLNSGAYNGNHLIIGSYHLWVDGAGSLRIKSSAPSSDTDGSVVGSQTTP